MPRHGDFFFFCCHGDGDRHFPQMLPAFPGTPQGEANVIRVVQVTTHVLQRLTTEHVRAGQSRCLPCWAEERDPARRLLTRPRQLFKAVLASHREMLPSMHLAGPLW